MEGPQISRVGRCTQCLCTVLKDLKRFKTLESNFNHPRKAPATRTATLSGLDFSGRAELNKCSCNSAAKICAG